MKDESSIRQELIEKLERQIENVKNDDTFAYIMGNARIATLAHVLELDLVNRIQFSASNKVSVPVDTRNRVCWHF